MNRLTERYKIARLIARKVSGTISEEEADELEAWVGSSARYREEVTRIESRLREDIRQGRELNMTFYTLVEVFCRDCGGRRVCHICVTTSGDENVCTDRSIRGEQREGVQG